MATEAYKEHLIVTLDSGSIGICFNDNPQNLLKVQSIEHAKAIIDVIMDFKPISNPKYKIGPVILDRTVFYTVYVKRWWGWTTPLTYHSCIELAKRDLFKLLVPIEVIDNFKSGLGLLCTVARLELEEICPDVTDEALRYLNHALKEAYKLGQGNLKAAIDTLKSL